MYRILIQLQMYCPKNEWIKLVEQARKAGKITADEYEKLME